MREPNGRTAGSAAQMPRRVRAPEAVLPGMVYAVAVNCIRGGAGDGAGAGAACGGTLATSRRPRVHPATPISNAASVDVTRKRRIAASCPRAVLLDQVEQAVVVDRLLEDGRDAERRRSLAQVAPGVDPRVGDRRDFGEPRILQLLGTKLEPVFARHQEIQKDETRLETAVELGERRLAVAGGDDRVPARLQEIAERLAQIGVVLDDEDRLLGNGRATVRTLRRRRLARRRRRSRSAKSHAVKWSKRRAKCAAADSAQ